MLAEAQVAVERLPSQLSDRSDDRDIPLVTLDPLGSQDLDQAVHIAPLENGYRVHYAIADMTAFVQPGGELDRESRQRGLTLYSPDLKTPLYPAILTEGAASLLPDQDRLAVLWTIDLDEKGEPTEVSLRRTVVRSRAQLDYDSAQRDSDTGSLHPSIELLPRVGRFRLQSARRRHAIDLDIPDSEVVADEDGRWTLRRRALARMETFNAQISLLTGMSAAQIMLDGGTGILRTVPAPGKKQLHDLRRSARMLDIPWPDGMPVGDVVSGLDSRRGNDAAFIDDARSLLRGAGYVAFGTGAPHRRSRAHGGALSSASGSAPDRATDGRDPAPMNSNGNDDLPPKPPRDHEHAGLAAPYTHVTAPLRRLVDRFATEVCVALHQERAIPSDVLQALPELDGIMSGASSQAGQLGRAYQQAVSEFLLAPRVGSVLTGIVVQHDAERGRARVLLDDPPVRVNVEAADAAVREGSRAALRLEGVDRDRHEVTITVIA